MAAHQVAAAKFKTERKKNPKKQETQRKQDPKSKREPAEAKAVPKSNEKPAEVKAVPKRKRDSRKKDTKSNKERAETQSIPKSNEKPAETRAVAGGEVGEATKGSKQKKAAVKKTEVLLPQELRSGEIAESNLMIAAEKWLGQGYKDMGNGRYLSKDRLRQFRHGKHETKNITKQHAHFEAYDRPHGIGGKLIEKAVLDVIE